MYLAFELGAGGGGLGEGDEGRDGALAGEPGVVDVVVLADIQEGEGGDLLLPRGANRHHLD